MEAEIRAHHQAVIIATQAIVDQAEVMLQAVTLVLVQIKLQVVILDQILTHHPVAILVLHRIPLQAVLAIEDRHPVLRLVLILVLHRVLHQVLLLAVLAIEDLLLVVRLAAQAIQDRLTHLIVLVQQGPLLHLAEVAVAATLGLLLHQEDNSGISLSLS